MGIRILIGVLIVMLACPPVSHGFGLMRWMFDAVANQLGLDRGPIPKVLPQAPNPSCPPNQVASDRPPESPRLHIQAEGF
jgi:hypothetical protein